MSRIAGLIPKRDAHHTIGTEPLSPETMRELELSMETVVNGHWINLSEQSNLLMYALQNEGIQGPRSLGGEVTLTLRDYIVGVRLPRRTSTVAENQCTPQNS